MRSYTRGSLQFDLDDLGDPDGPAVVLLHGFPQDRRCWRAGGGVGDDAGSAPPVGGVAGALVDAGYRVFAPDQRGYSPGARPPHRRDYRLELLAHDVLDLADAAGVRRFHLVGHDWGAVVAWHVAATAFSRVQSLTALSVPHPRAFAAGGRRQALRSWYMLAFQIPGVERPWQLAGGRLAAAALRRSGLPDAPARRYADRLADPPAARAALDWYRALPWSGRTPAVTVPTLMVWGRWDPFVAGRSVEANRSWVAGRYRELPVDAGHWLPETVADQIVPELLAHLSQ